ncbi:hypothetical protein ACJ41O_003823 [Fusarium nematophilum]
MLSPSLLNPPLALQPDTVYRNDTDKELDPGSLFTKATRYLGSLQQLVSTEEHHRILSNVIEGCVIHSIYGSNKIEHAGLGQEATFYLCRRILSGDAVPVFDGRQEDEPGLHHLITVDESLRGQPRETLLRGGREVVQHLHAFQHLIQRFAVSHDDLTEDLIKETHAILCSGLAIIDEDMPEVPSEKYAGRYRDVAVGAGSTMFIMPKYVPLRMKELCDSLREEMRTKESEGGIDPFSLAAKYSLQFVDIHPFQDGNGRMCRLILNAILFRYIGIVVAIGERDGDVREYIGIKKRASMEMEGHGEYATFVLKRGAKTIQKLKQRLNGKRAP